MAAGRVDVPRGNDVWKLNRGYPHAIPHKNGYNYSSNGKNLVSQHKNGFDLGSRRCGLEDVVRIKNDVMTVSNGEVQQPPQKKRKFSPIACEREGKETRFSPNVSERDVKKQLVSANLIEKVERFPLKTTVSDCAVLSPSTHGQQFQNDELGQDFMGNENIGAPNIFTSRWASDCDDGDVTQNEEKIGRSLSLESGELGREELEGDVLSNEISSSVLSACEEEGNECKSDTIESDDIGQSDVDDEEPAGRGMNMLLGCRSVFEYEKLNKISEGTYGIVFRAKDKKTGEIVALKKVKILDKRDSEEYGFPLTSLREINILASFNHPSIVKVKEVVVDNHDNVYMVMEYMDQDLKGLLVSVKQPLSTTAVKCLMLQLLQGVKYLHDNWVLHRDLKTSNLLLNSKGELKICDFGMARQYGSPLKPYTTKVVTQWYRAPELLLGAKKYSTAVDMWSVGCIMAELLTKDALFKGKSEIDQLHKIFDKLGTPTEEIWPGFSELPGAKANYSKENYSEQPMYKWLGMKNFSAFSFSGSPVLCNAGFDLLKRLLTYDPEKRITADDALNHDWFSELRALPQPEYKEFFPTFH